MDKERVTTPRIETIRSRPGLHELGGSTLAKVWVRAACTGLRYGLFPSERRLASTGRTDREASGTSSGPVVKNWLVAAKRS